MMISFFSCQEKEIELNIPFEGEKVVVEGRIFPNEPLKIRLYKTFDPDSEAINIELKAATVLLIENDSVIDTLEYLPEPGELFLGSLYCSKTNFLPDFNDSYRIHVQAPGLPTAQSAKIHFPEAPEIDNLTADLDTAFNRFNLSLQLDAHNVTPQNAHLISVHAFYPLNNLTDTLINIFALPVDDRFIQSDKIQVVLNKIDLMYRLLGPDNQFQRVQPHKQIVISLIVYSPGYKQYLEDIDNFMPEIGGFFPGGSIVSSNIEGGYGFFGAGNKDTIIIQL